MIEVLLFYISILINFFYFLIKPRIFDFYTLAFLSSIVYFLPAFFGFDLWHEELKNKVYLIFFLFEINLFTFALFFDVLINNIKLNETIFDFSKNSNKCIINLVIFIAVSNILLIIMKHGIGVFFIPKTQMGIDGKLLILWRISASILFIYGVLYRDKMRFFIGFLLVLLTFIAGDRTTLVLSILTIFLIKTFQQNKNIFIIKNIRLIIFMLFFSFFILIGKLFQSIIYLIPKYTLLEAFKINFLSFNIVDAISKTEPFIIQMILNKVVMLDFRIQDPSYIFYSIFQLLPINIYKIISYGYSTTYFNDQIQSQIFTMFREHSIAYNFLAEGYAFSGLLGVILFIVIFNIVTLFYNMCLYKCKNNILKISIMLMGSYHVFYIHRNSLYSIISYEKQIFYFIIVLILLCSIKKIKAN